MSTPTNTDRKQNTAQVVPFNSARRYRERSYGTGYGTSSGYAADKRYSSDWGQLRFRCA